MKKKLVMLFAAILLVSVFVTAYPVLSADDDNDDALRCEVYGELNPEWVDAGGVPSRTIPSFTGTFSGDIEGDFEVFLLADPYFDYQPTDPSPPAVPIFEVFWEEWIIKAKGGKITMLNAGVWDFETGKVQSAGTVVAATGKWKYYIDSTVFARGEVVIPDPPALPYGILELWILPFPS